MSWVRATSASTHQTRVWFGHAKSRHRLRDLEALESWLNSLGVRPRCEPVGLIGIFPRVLSLSIPPERVGAARVILRRIRRLSTFHCSLDQRRLRNEPPARR